MAPSLAIHFIYLCLLLSKPYFQSDQIERQRQILKNGWGELCMLISNTRADEGNIKEDVFAGKK